MSHFNVGDVMNEQEERDYWNPVNSYQGAQDEGDYYRATELEICPVCAGPTEDVAGGPCDACWDVAPRSEEGA